MKRMLLTAVLFWLFSTFGWAQTGFNFQGRLNDGANPANGYYDLKFKLFDQLAGGNQISSTIDVPNQTLINGVFSTQLDFSLTAFYNTSMRFIEVSLRPTATGNNPPNAFVILGPRHQILYVPFAIQSVFAGIANSAATSTNSDHATQADNATNAANAQKLGGIDAARFVQQDASGNVGISGNAKISGNLTQPLAMNGLPKAIVFLDRDGAIVRCYNGITGASTGDCGFSTNHPLTGIYTIYFGFSVPGRPVVLTSFFDEKTTVATADFHSGDALGITIRYITDDSDNGKRTDSPISVVVY